MLTNLAVPFYQLRSFMALRDLPYKRYIPYVSFGLGRTCFGLRKYCRMRFPLSWFDQGQSQMLSISKKLDQITNNGWVFLTTCCQEKSRMGDPGLIHGAFDTRAQVIFTNFDALQYILSLGRDRSIPSCQQHYFSHAVY